MVKASEIANGPQIPRPQRPQQEQVAPSEYDDIDDMAPELREALQRPSTIKFDIPNQPTEIVHQTEDGPVSDKDYSPMWESIKRYMRDNGLGYMIDTPEKRRAQARNIGSLIGLAGGTMIGKISVATLQQLGILPK